MNSQLLDIVMALAAVISAGAVGVVCCVGFVVWLAGACRPAQQPRRP